MTNFLLIVLAFALVLLNSFFVAAEFAIVKIRHTRVQTIKSVYGLRGKILAQIHTHLDAYLSACQLGITLASLGLGWVGEPAFADLLEPLFHLVGIKPPLVTFIAFLIAFFFISFLHIVVGELAPKSVAIRQPEKTSLWTSIPLYIFYWAMYPIIWFLNYCAYLILKWLGIEMIHKETSYSPEELKVILHASHLHKEFAKEELEILERALDFANLVVADIMRPVDEMVTLCLNHSVEKNIKKIVKYRYSRYPVYKDDPLRIIGILHVKDLFAALQTSEQLDLSKLIRPVLTVNTEAPAVELFHQFRLGLAHFAIVTTEMRTVVGFVTLDNILSVLLGKISDEFIKSRPDWIEIEGGALLMKGQTPIYTLEKALNIEIAEQEMNTISGLLVSHLGRIPKKGEKISFDKFDVVVEKVKGPRILLVKIYPKRI